MIPEFPNQRGTTYMCMSNQIQEQSTRFWWVQWSEKISMYPNQTQAKPV